MTPNTARLRTLAAALIHEATFTGTHKFDFHAYFDSNECGTSACAIGLGPTVLPDDWKMVTEVEAGVILNLQGSDGSTDDDTCFWFSLNYDQQCHLFQPTLQSVNSYGYPFNHRLDYDATAAEVAANIIAFCDYYQPRSK